MSNDLISRKEAVELVIAEYDRFQANGGSYSGRHELDRVIKMLQNMPTAFDKDKVIEELVELRQREYNDSDEESETMDGEEIYDEGRSQGRFEAYHRAIKIIEKGGIE